MARATFPILLLAAGCGYSGGAIAPTEVPGDTVPATSQPVAEEVDTARFANPGGMWTPAMIRGQAETLRKLGLIIEPATLSDPSSTVLQSIVSLGGCSGSFVSPDGLLVTNHHCAQSAMQYSSTPAANLAVTGFLAKTRGEEKWNGPAARVRVTGKIEDVTDKVLEGIDAIADPKARHDQIEAREKKLVAGCEMGRPHLRCSVGQLYGGAGFQLVEQLEIRDVRLVYAPPAGIGNFGGEVDNWMWPRHTGDFAFYRAYVGPDGLPADHAARNVPFKSDHHLTMATTPLSAGDLVLVAGYPGKTDRPTSGSHSFARRPAASWRTAAIH